MCDGNKERGTYPMNFTYHPQGVCSRQISFTLKNGVIHSASFVGGCNGNLKGICSLIEGQPAEEIIPRLEGICCGMKSTSCPDQLSKALRSALEQENN